MRSKYLSSVAPSLMSKTSEYATMAAAQNSAQNDAATNIALRQALLATGVRQKKNLGNFKNSAGDTLRVKLFNVGVTTKLILFVSATLTIGTANAVKSLKGPYNLINRVRLTDYDGTDRVNCSGFQLWMLNSNRKGLFYGENNALGQSNDVGSVFTNPAYPIATGNVTVSFFLEVPIAYDVDNKVPQLQDLRGAILSQTAVGEMYLNIDFNPTLVANGSIDALYSGAGTTTVVGNPVTNYITTTVWQDFIMPQAVNGKLPLPLIDLQTVYEIAGYLKSQDNIVANGDKLLNYPNLRSVIGAYYHYVTNGTAAQGNVSQFRQIANGNNILFDESELAALMRMRTELNSDFVPGAYWRRMPQKPVETALFGNVQDDLTIATASGGNQYVEIMYESFFVKGAALPGLQQASG